MDHFGAPFALSLGLAGNGAHHRLIQVDVLDLHVGHLDAPGIGLGVQNLLHVQVEPLALGQHFVQLVLAQHHPQGGLGQLAGGLQVVLHLNDGLGRVHHAKEHHRVDLDRHVVARNHVLRLHVHGHHPQVHPHHLLQPGNDDHQPRPLDLPEPAQLKHHAALVFAQHAKRRGQQRDGQRQQKHAQAEIEIKEHHKVSFIVC